jgi:FdhD protein
MTLGAAPEWLVLGYLRNQRLIDDVAAVRSVEVDWAQGVANVTSRGGILGEPSSAGQGSGPAPLGCALGTVFGDVMRRVDAGAGTTSMAADRTSAAARLQGRSLPHAQLLAILESMRRHDAIHRAAGSVHSCALFRGDELWVAVEDVSRHNGVDTLTGFMRLHGVDGADKILFTTGRLTGEMVMKAAHNGIPLMISRNGTTAVGYELAAKLGMTLIGRAANRRYLCYVGAERIAT